MVGAVAQARNSLHKRAGSRGNTVGCVGNGMERVDAADAGGASDATVGASDTDDDATGVVLSAAGV